MNLGRKIAKIRKDNKMSQEEFAEIFNVSRQTISSWENSKSYPDIETLVKLSDEFKISLDILLKGDNTLIKKYDEDVKKGKKYRNILIIIGSICLVFMISFGSYFAIYKYKEKVLMNKFTESLQKNNFKKNKEGYYSKKDGEIVFSVPNQKMPNLLDFSLHFHNMAIYCDIYYKDESHLEAKWNDYNDYNFSLEKDNIIVGSSASIKDKSDIYNLSKELNISEDELKDIIKKGNKLYKEFYK